MTLAIKPRKRTIVSVWRVVAGIVCVAGIGLAGYWVWGYSQRHAVNQPAPSQTFATPAPVLLSLESNTLVMGDVYWGRYINDWSKASALGYAYPFSRLSEFNRDAYDAWIANMECPLTNNPKVSSREEDTYLKFDCSPAYLPEAKKWFTAVTLANNHTDNQGASGYAETKQHLDENGMQYFGGYDPEDHENTCDVISLPARVVMSDGSTKQGKLPVVWCGYNGVFRIPSAAAVGVVSSYSSLFNVVVMPHSGAEYKPGPDEIKTTLYRSFIDAGADVVIGNHAHWIQSTEAYKGHLIAYSMGNFIFDQQGALEVTRSAVVRMDLSLDAKTSPDLEKWLALGETCSGYADDCLAKASKQKLTKLPLKYHFAVLGSRDDGKLVHAATEVELAAIKQRMNWSATIKGLSGVYTGE